MRSTRTWPGSWSVPAPVLDAIFTHVDDAPATPVARNPQRVISWLKSHVREPLDTYFAYEDASVQDIKACARAAGFTGNVSQSPLLTYMTIKSRLQAFALKLVGKAIVGTKGHTASDSIGTLHFSHWVPFENNHIGFFTIFDGSFEKYRPGLRRPNLVRVRRCLPHVIGAPPTPVAKNTRSFCHWALVNNHRPIGFYSAYPGLSVQDIKALLADRKSRSATI